jgi:hypothetical protein
MRPRQKLAASSLQHEGLAILSIILLCYQLPGPFRFRPSTGTRCSYGSRPLYSFVLKQRIVSWLSHIAGASRANSSCYLADNRPTFNDGPAPRRAFPNIRRLTYLEWRMPIAENVIHVLVWFNNRGLAFAQFQGKAGRGLRFSGSAGPA